MLSGAVGPGRTVLGGALAAPRRMAALPRSFPDLPRPAAPSQHRMLGYGANPPRSRRQCGTRSRPQRRRAATAAAQGGGADAAAPRQPPGGGGGSSESGAGSDSGPPMRPLEDPSSAPRPGQLQRQQQGRPQALQSSRGDESPEQPQQPLALLQRIALNFLSRLAALVPPWLRAAFSGPFLRRFVALGLLAAVGVAMSLGAHMGGRRAGPSGPQEVVYSEFVRLVESGNVRAARFEEGSSQRITFDLRPHSSETGGHLAQPGASAAAAGAPAASDETSVAVMLRGRGPTPRQFYTHRVGGPAAEAALLQMLMAAGVEFGIVKASISSSLAKILVSALALWIPLLPLFIIMRRMLDERMGGGSRKRKKGEGRSAPRTTFADVAGVGGAKEELAEVVACLRSAGQYQRLGAKMPSGVLLCGPPGTGKTLLARAVAGEAGVPFFSASASEFVELFVGRGAARIRELFAEARKKAPCVVFIDELDAVGGKRGMGLNEERDQTLNQLLTELDGFEGRPGVLLLAATNRPDVLDAALVRPGRLSRKVIVPLPDEGGRADILRVHLRGVPLAEGEDVDIVCEALAKVTGGFSGAELANVVNEAALLSARRSLNAVNMAELLEAVYRTKYGVNGGQPVLPFGAGLKKRLVSWLVDVSSSNKSVRGAMGQ